jgi:5-methylcytosine-specific restriction endonuclease McrA
MPRHTLSKAKNYIKKTFLDLADRHASKAEIERLWDYFRNQCAYCGKEFRRREAHIDHLEARAGGGKNHISNLVLACGVCNGDEKRDRNWDHYLESKWSHDPEGVLTSPTSVTALEA